MNRLRVRYNSGNVGLYEDCKAGELIEWALGIGDADTGLRQAIIRRRAEILKAVERKLGEYEGDPIPEEEVHNTIVGVLEEQHFLMSTTAFRVLRERGAGLEHGLSGERAQQGE